MAKILIAGCGDIGIRLAGLLHGQGHCVFGLRRNPPATDSKSINYICADINNSNDLAQLDRDFDQVFYMPTSDRRNRKSYEDIYINGLNKLLQTFSKAKNKPHFFFVSSTSVYGQTNGEWVDEYSVTKPVSETARLISIGEQIIWQNNPNHTVVRFSGIYGLGRERLLRKLENGDQIQYQPPYYTNRIHQDDCAAVLSFLCNKKLSGSKLKSCYLASDDTPEPLWDVMSWLAKYTDNRLPERLQQEATPNQNKRCQNDRLKQLGYRFLYPSYREGYKFVNKIA